MRAPLSGLAALPLALLTLVALVLPASGVAFGQAAPTARLSLGVADQLVAEAWNPLRLELRDAPPATLTIQIDQGTLRSGEVPLTVSFSVRGGAGISIFEELLYLPRFARLSWRLATQERVLASGSVAGREADVRPLDLLLTSTPGAYRPAYQAAFGAGGRLADVAASELPLAPAAYDGVRSLLIDGSSAAPRLEALAAAVAGGAVVTLLGPLPASHAELALLLGGAAATRLGAGALLYSEAALTEAVEAMATTQLPRRDALLAALLEEPLVVPPTAVKETVVALVAAAFALSVLLLLRWAGAPGLITALALAALLSLVGWRQLRPAAPQLTGNLTLALVGDTLALELPAREVLTLPRATLHVEGRARPLRVQAYGVDDAGTHLNLERWRAVLLELAPRLVEAPLVLVDGAPSNRGAATLHDLFLVGAGALGDLPPGAELPVPTEAGGFAGYQRLAPLLPAGAVLARSDCEDACVVWVAYPPLEHGARAPAPGEPGVVAAHFEAEAAGETGQSGWAGLGDPFRGAEGGR